MVANRSYTVLPWIYSLLDSIMPGAVNDEYVIYRFLKSKRKANKTVSVRQREM